MLLIFCGKLGHSKRSCSVIAFSVRPQDGLRRCALCQGRKINE